MSGRVRMYEAGFLIFVLGSLTCTLAWNDASIIGFRISPDATGRCCRCPMAGTVSFC